MTRRAAVITTVKQSGFAGAALSLTLALAHLPGAGAAGGRDGTKSAIGRPVDVLQMPDGSILISDDRGNRLMPHAVVSTPFGVLRRLPNVAASTPCIA